MQLTVQQPDLSQMFGQDNLYNTLYGMQRMDQANANNAQNLGQAQQEQQFQAQDQPYNLQQLAANVGHTQAMTGLANAQIPGAAADSTLKANAASADSSVPASIRNNKALNDYLAKASQSDLEAHANQAQMDLYDPDPNVRANAQKVLMSMPAVAARFQEIQLENAGRANVAGIEANSAQNINTAKINAGEFANKSMDYLLLKAKTSGNFQAQAGALNTMADRAMANASQTTDPDERQFYINQANQYRQQSQEAVYNDYRAKQAAGTAANAAKPDINQLGVPSVVQPNALPQAPVPQQPQLPTDQPAQSPTKLPPKPGSIVMHGGSIYRFKGGDPSNPSNWEKQ